MIVTCSNCNSSLEIEPQYAGLTFECPTCNTEFIASRSEVFEVLDKEVKILELRVPTKC